MNSNKDELPEGWLLCDSKSIPGKKYYFNRKTGKASWTQPQAESSKPGQEKSKTPCKSSKNDSRRNSLKRKSDCTDEGTSKKKNKYETKTPEKHTSSPRKKVTPSKSKNVTPVGSSSKNSTPKNLANTRLSQLREKLNAEAKLENSKLQTPKTTSLITTTETPAKVAKPDLKSPGLNDSKSSIASIQSPTSDSLHSSPSPSQFLAANKIISSMKSQLQEEYTEKLKPKDTFADIEQGICNQSAEYSYAKHPSTPPQFTEANKLVSAIKSKLTYKASSRDTTTSTFSSAKDRMEALRRSLKSEGDKKDDKEVFLNKSLELPRKRTDVAMEVEDCNMTTPTTTSNIPLPVIHVRETPICGDDVVLVVDTNIFIHELNVLKSVLNSHIKGYSEQPTLLIPWRVINELDRLKDNNNGNGAICKRAKSAMDYLYKSLPENNRIKGQSLRDSNSHIYPCEIPDDEILNCCLQQAERGKSVILLSNDKNLCNKAVINQVKCLSLNDLKPLLVNKPQPSSNTDLYASVKHYRDTMYQLLANILENEMQAKYKKLWQHVLLKPPPWSLVDVLQCLLKHWIAVFNEVFPRIQHLLTDLRNTLVSIEDKDTNTLTQSEVANFKDLCLDVARKCQIIPEYLQLAKSTVDRLSRDCASEKAESERDGEMLVIDAFERIWTVFSSYCAKLSTNLGISHNIEDKLPGDDPLEVLRSKFSVFSNHIHSLTLAIKGALSTENGCSTEKQISKLEEVFRESLNLLCMDPGGVSKSNVKLFCNKCRNMLQEACIKFTQLSDLLDVCKSHI